jgi:uncharacterized membrane protein YphA (DoxX/SURF4 family)/glutaredoxin
MESVDIMERPRRRFSSRDILASVVLAILALTFLASAVSKLSSMDAFRWALLDAGVPGDMLAAIGARVLVGIELGLGILLLLRISLRRIAFPLALALLGIFSAYLVVMIVRQGNAGDCGCFGKWLPMKPLPALLKNVALAVGLVAVRGMHVREWRVHRSLATLFMLGAIGTTFFVSPLNTGKETVNLAPIYSQKPAPPAGIADVRKGKHVVAFMSLGCPHCREAAKIFHVFLQQNPKLPVVLVLNGLEEDAGDFFHETKARNVPHLFVPDVDSFVKMSGQYVPSIYYLNGGIIERRVSYRTMTRTSIEAWAGR